jgi:hypothetical protein
MNSRRTVASVAAQATVGATARDANAAGVDALQVAGGGSGG